MFHEILKFLFERRDEIASAWAKKIIDTLSSYRLLQEEKIRKSTRIHLDALLLCIEKKDNSALKLFLEDIAPGRSRLNLKLSETQQAFMIGKSLLWNKILQNFRANQTAVLPFLKMIDDCFCLSLFYYSEIYQKIQLQEIEKRSKALVKAEEEKKYLERLKIEYKKLDEIVSAIGANLVLVDHDGRVIWTNRLIRDRVGENVVGKNCHEIYIEEFSPCRNCVVGEAFRTKRQQHHLRRTRDKQGNPRYFQIISTPILDEQGNVREVLELMQDVTELKILENQLDQKSGFLQAVMASSADAVIGLDPELRITSWNRGAQSMFGYDEEEILGKPLSILIPEDLKQKKELEWISQQIRKSGYIRNYETERLTKDGRRLQVEITRTVIYDRDGKILGSSAILRDISERKALEARLLQSERLATIGKMAARVAHEIRNPLSSISLNVELLEDEIQAFQPASTEESRTLLKAISEEVDRLTQITEEYLQFSRFPKSQFHPGNVNEVLEDLLDFMEFEFSKKNIAVESYLDSTVPDSWLDRAQMRQALLNIIRNAIESMKENGKLEIRTSSDGDGIIRIEIKDTGEGISPENLEKIFDPFYTTKDVGTGLGLPMSQQIVSEHQGKIVCKSESGVGTTFTILLPQYPGKGEIIGE